MSWMYLGSIESIDAILPCSLHALFDYAALLCAPVGEPAPY